MPLHLAGGRLQRQHRADVQRIAAPGRGVPGRAVARAPVHQVELGVVGAGQPGGGTTGLGHAGLPGVGALVRAGGGGPAVPLLLAGLQVPAVQEATRAVLATADAGDQHPAGDQGRMRHAVALLVVGCLRLPQLLAVLHGQRDHVCIQRGAVEHAVERGRAPAVDAAAQVAVHVGRQLHRHLPLLPAGQRVDRQRVRVGGDVHHPVDQQRLGAGVGRAVEAQVPHRHQLLHVGGRDLLERRMPLLAPTHAVRGHVARRGRILAQVVQGLGGHGAAGGGHGGAQQQPAPRTGRRNGHRESPVFEGAPRVPCTAMPGKV